MFFSRTGSLIDLFTWLFMAFLWWAGGWLLVTHLFHQRRSERLLSGLAAGLLLAVVFSNLLAYLLPLPAAWGLASGLVLGLGLLGAFFRPLSSWQPREDFAAWPQIVALAGLLLLFSAINRGLAIFDDYHNLPVVSLLAAGDFPPHFYLDPGQPLVYHYGLHLFAAGLARVGGLYSWSAYDLSKSLSLALALLLGWLWLRRSSGSRTGAALGVLLLLLGGGTRWLLLALTENQITTLGVGLRLLGSALATGPDLNTVLVSPWKIEGGGPFPFPFAFANGIFPPLTMALGSSSALPHATILLLLLLSQPRWQPARGIVYGLLVASLALTAEHLLVVLGVGWVLAALVSLVRRRRPAGLVSWAWVLLPAVMLAVLGGGVLSGALGGLVSSASGRDVGAGFAGFAVRWPPALLSAHLGPLDLTSPRQLLIALLEAGPALLLAPWVVVYSIRRARRGLGAFAWLGLGSTAVFLLSLVFVYGVERDTSRLAGSALWTWLVLGFPLAWQAWRRWGLRRAGDWLQAGLVGVYLVTILGGGVLFAVEWMAISRPQITYYASAPDATMSRSYWDQLEPGAWVLDPIPYRSVALFGRSAGPAFGTIYDAYPEWLALAGSLDPAQAAQAGYAYIYLDKETWQRLPPDGKQRLQQPCVQLLAEETTGQKDFRRLLDIRKCLP